MGVKSLGEPVDDVYSAPGEGAAVVDPQYVSVSQEDYRLLLMKATLGRVLGRNIERAAAAWALLFSFLLVSLPAGPSFFAPLADTFTLGIWAWIVGVLSAARGITLIVNGWWPVTLKVRVFFCVATLFTVWTVLTSLAWVSTGARGMIYPSAVLAPFAATVEVLCFLALRTRIAAEAQGVDNVGRSVGSGGGWRSQLVAGVRERLGQAPKQVHG